MEKIQNLGVQYSTPNVIPTERDIQQAVRQNRQLDGFAVMVNTIEEFSPILGPSFPFGTRLWYVQVLCAVDHHNGGQQCEWRDSAYWFNGNIVVLRQSQEFHTSVATLVKLLTTSPTIPPEKGTISWQQY